LHAGSVRGLCGNHWRRGRGAALGKSGERRLRTCRQKEGCHAASATGSSGHIKADSLVRNLSCPRTLRVWGVSGEVRVKKVEEYLQHASECRALARASPPAHREQLEEMALTWEQLAEARRGKITKQLKAALGNSKVSRSTST